jgi:hypothetical protein
MSQAGIVDIEGSHPQIPTIFVTDMGTAIPIANVLEILGTVVAAHSIPLETTGSGNTVTIVGQYSSSAGASVANNAGVSSFNSAQFTVDSNGFVSLSGSGAAEAFQVDASTPPGTNPVTPNGSGIVTITGGQVAAGTTTNVIRTDSLAASTYTIQIQRSQAVAASTIGDNGVSHFNSTYFTVDANGFVSLNGSGVGETITGNTGGALSPTAGNWNILGSSTAPGAIPVQTAGSGSTLTVQIQKSQAIGATNATNVGLSAFNSTYFTVDSNGFVSINGAAIGETITGNTGGALSPTSGNWNILGASTAAGTTPVQTSGSGSTLTVQVQKTQAIAATNATNVGLAAFDSAHFTVDANGFVTLSGTGSLETLTGNSGGAISPTAGNINTLGTGSITISGSGSTLTTQLTGLTNHALQIGAGTATLTQLGAGTTGQVLQTNTTADPTWSTATYPSTTTINQILYSSANNVVGGITAANNGTLISGTTGVPSWLANGTTGQILTATTGSPPSWAANSAANAILTITGNSGGAESPLANNFNILGTGSITVAGSANTETVQLTGLTNHALQVGAGTATLTQLGAGTTGQVLQTNTTADPTWSTATYPSTATGTGKILRADGTNWVATTATYPNTAGTSGNVLTSDGTNWISSSTPSSAFTSITVQTFTSSGTYTPTAGMLYCIIEVVGGGGGGGGIPASNPNSLVGGGGGGGGGYSKKVFSAATIGASQTVTIGGGGAGGAAGNNNGTAGSTSSVGALISATGGAGGISSTANVVVVGGQGGVGGVGSSGNLNANGFPGGNAFGLFVVGVTNGVNSGVGGSSIYGGGGLAVSQVASSATAGNAGTNYGGGGSGATGMNSASTAAGGAGAGGIVIVTEYI